MLFLLTGNVQTGKTRWLEAFLAELAEAGVTSVGVLAPGVWCRHDSGQLSPETLAAGGHAAPEGQPAFEKLGIDNVLLPQGTRLSFARRRDLAQDEGTFDPKSQSAAERLSWEISEDALAQVNAHLSSFGECAFHPAATSELLVIDEVGRLELLRNGGLTAALELIDGGPSPRFPHALAIVREQLLEAAQERFAAPWGGEVCAIEPNEEGRHAVRTALLGE